MGRYVLNGAMNEEYYETTRKQLVMKIVAVRFGWPVS
jgi:hypothetical protein